MVAYLKYLTYFKEPQYSRYIQYVKLLRFCYLFTSANATHRYPHCLFVLDLLLDETFRAQVPVAPVLIDALAEQQKFHWLYYRANRLNNTTQLVSERPIDPTIPQ